MRMTLREEGISEAVLALGTMVKEGRTAKDQALRDVGALVAKELRAGRQKGFGWKPLGATSRAKGNKRPWGKSKFSVYLLKRQSRVIVTTRGKNKNMEEGGTAMVSKAFKKFLHTKGIHMKASTDRVKIPARPLFGPVWDKVQPRIGKYFEVRFHYRLQRSLRRWRVK